jgi:hypothetical protein
LLLLSGRVVQTAHGSGRGPRTIEDVGSAHDELELDPLKAAACQQLAGGQAELDLCLGASISAAGVADSRRSGCAGVEPLGERR